MDFIDFLMILGTHSESFLGIFWIKKEVFFSISISRLLFLLLLSLNLGVWDCKNKDLAWKVLQKSIFAEIGFLVIPGSIFHDFRWPWDQFSWLLLPWRLA